MDNTGNSGGGVKKQEEVDTNDPKAKGEIKPPVRTLNRVPRACNACRKQKMRCEGAENPPCRRCRHAGLECLFEKPTREASLTGEAGLERIRAIEATQTQILNHLAEIIAHLRASSHYDQRPSGFPGFAHNTHQSPSIASMSSPSHGQTPTPGGVMSASHAPSQMMARRDHMAGTYQSPSMTAAGHRPVSATDVHGQAVGNLYSPQQGHPQAVPQGTTTLPPFSTIDNMSTSRSQPSNVSSVRYHDPGQRPRATGGPEGSSGSKRALPSSNVTSADSTDAEEDDGELPASGLVAPWEVLRGLADVAIERAAQENGGESEAPSRARTASPEPRRPRPSKRRKVQHKQAGLSVLPDGKFTSSHNTTVDKTDENTVVTKKIISEAEARELFRIFYHGCSTFLPVFDGNVDTFEALHDRSPFAVDCICMVAARVRDGGGNPSEIFLKCQEEVQAISCATLFSPVVRQEAVQAMILVSGWSDNGWLSGGHAVRMAMEISMHKAWPELLKRMKANKAGTSPKDRQLVVGARTWFCLYLFEHQMSYGTGRPAILKDDESIWNCRLLLQHPLAIEDDMRLVSTVELMAIRERVHNNLAPTFDRPVDEATFNVLRDADAEFRNWYTTWDQAFSQKYENAAFYRQSLQIQHLTAELFHNATALRGINGPEDVQCMPHPQRELALRSIQVGRQILEITVNSPAYKEGMKYAVHYTHAAATFSASFLLRLCRLFPENVDVQDIRVLVERLAALLAEVPGKRYALTLQLMLKRFKRRKTGSMSKSPKQLGRPGHHRSQSEMSGHSQSPDVPIGHPMAQHQHHPHTPISPAYETGYHPEAMTPHGVPHMPQHPQTMGQYAANASNVEHIWRGFESTSSEQLPVWLSDQNLGGASFSQNGIDAFLLPTDYLPPGPQIW